MQVPDVRTAEGRHHPTEPRKDVAQHWRWRRRRHRGRCWTYVMKERPNRDEAAQECERPAPRLHHLRLHPPDVVMRHLVLSAQPFSLAEVIDRLTHFPPRVPGSVSHDGSPGPRDEKSLDPTQSTRASPPTG